MKQLSKKKQRNQKRHDQDVSERQAICPEEHPEAGFKETIGHRRRSTLMVSISSANDTQSNRGPTTISNSQHAPF